MSSKNASTYRRIKVLMVIKQYKTVSPARLLREWREWRWQARVEEMERVVDEWEQKPTEVKEKKVGKTTDLDQPILPGVETWSTQPLPESHRIEQSEEKEARVAKPISDEMVAWLNAKRMVVKDLTKWRWITSTDPGEINGLPTSRGKARMTNGILVLVERLDGSVMIGHFDWWKWDKATVGKREQKARENVELAARLKELLAE